ERSPVILQIGQRAIRNAGMSTMVQYIRHFGEQVTIPVSIHLDHGGTFDQAVLAIQRGFTSVMIDASHHPLDDNISVTCDVVRVARAAGVSVEAELGKISGVEDNLSVEEEDALL